MVTGVVPLNSGGEITGRGGVERRVGAARRIVGNLSGPTQVRNQAVLNSESQRASETQTDPGAV